MIKELYEMSQTKGDEFEVPFIDNVNGDSPLDLCMKKSEYKNADLFF